MVLVRIGLAVLTANELMIGLWNQFWPASFYANFPTVDLTPPFSEHYARDFGGTSLGIGIILLIALIRPQPLLVLSGSLAYTVFAIPHFVFHLEHLEGATGFEAITLTAANASVAVIGVLLVVWSAVNRPTKGVNAGARKAGLRAPN
jgi:hypothetical protein